MMAIAHTNGDSWASDGRRDRRWAFAGFHGQEEKEEERRGKGRGRGEGQNGRGEGKGRERSPWREGQHDMRAHH